MKKYQCKTNPRSYGRAFFRPYPLGGTAHPDWNDATKNLPH